MSDIILTYQNRRIEELSREELIEAAYHMWKERELAVDIERSRHLFCECTTKTDGESA